MCLMTPRDNLESRHKAPHRPSLDSTPPCGQEMLSLDGVTRLHRRAVEAALGSLAGEADTESTGQGNDAVLRELWLAAAWLRIVHHAPSCTHPGCSGRPHAFCIYRFCIDHRRR